MATKVAPKKPPARAAADHVLYLYGITKELPGEARISNRGIDGVAAVEPVSCAGLLCWVSRVNRSEYADRLAENMENLDWLAATSLRHQQVVSEIASRTTILPARFGTVFVTRASLAADVQRRRSTLLKSFKRLAEADEWGIKIFALAQPQSQISAASGKDYLRQKAAALKKPSTRVLEPEVKKFITELDQLAADTAPGGKVSSGQAGLEWHGSLLLRREKYQQFQRILDQYSQRWQGRHRIECTGPWPPYSFVKDE
jgi:hypothetical protein